MEFSTKGGKGGQDPLIKDRLKTLEYYDSFTSDYILTVISKMAEENVSEINVIRSNEDEMVCLLNKFGYCKFLGKCKFKHEDTVCSNPTCEIW